MRKINLTILIAAILMVFTLPTKAQVHLNINVDISSQPIWGPTGYDEVQYYYLPDIDVYYNVPEQRYIYQRKGHWITSSHLPYRYRNYDLYNGYKVVINENKPYMHDNDYRVKYASYKGRHDQQPIRDSKDSKYFVIKNHPEHSNWVKGQKQDSNKSKAPGKGNRNSKNNRQDDKGKKDRQK
jgi:hypothetical protein